MKKILACILGTVLMTGTLSAQDKNTISDVLENTLAGVVTVAIYNTDTYSQVMGFRGEASNADEAYRKALNLGNYMSSGSGFVVDLGGTPYVITNYHVVGDALDSAGNLKVYSINRTAYEAKIVGGDAFYDIAVLKFTGHPGKEIIPIKFRTTEPRIGERVFAIGNPLGEFPYSVSDGIISAKNRVRGGLTGKFGYLQTTATIIWGNSGGPLVDQQGQVTGINTYIEFTNTPGGGTLWTSQINFALEAKLAQRLVNNIVTHGGRVERSYFGIEFSKKAPWADDSDENAYAQKINEAPVITGILPNSPASTRFSGKEGRAVKAINNEEVRNMEELLGALEGTRPEQEVVFTLAVDSVTVEKVSIRSVALKTRQLEEIARFFFKKDKTLKIQENQTDVSVQFTPPRLTMIETDPGGVVPQTNYETKWTVVAAGRKTQQGGSMYRVHSFRDIGASLKLCSLSGALDLYMIPEKSPELGAKLFRFAFSDEAYNIGVLLYY